MKILRRWVTKRRRLIEEAQVETVRNRSTQAHDQWIGTLDDPFDRQEPSEDKRPEFYCLTNNRRLFPMPRPKAPIP